MKNIQWSNFFMYIPKIYNSTYYDCMRNYREYHKIGTVCPKTSLLKGEKDLIIPYLQWIEDKSSIGSGYLKIKQFHYSRCCVVYVDFDNGSPDNDGSDPEHALSKVSDFLLHKAKISYNIDSEHEGNELSGFPIKFICTGTLTDYREFNRIDRDFTFYINKSSTITYKKNDEQVSAPNVAIYNLKARINNFSEPNDCEHSHSHWIGKTNYIQNNCCFFNADIEITGDDKTYVIFGSFVNSNIKFTRCCVNIKECINSNAEADCVIYLREDSHSDRWGRINCAYNSTIVGFKIFYAIFGCNIFANRNDYDPSRLLAAKTENDKYRCRFSSLCIKRKAENCNIECGKNSFYPYLYYGYSIFVNCTLNLFFDCSPLEFNFNEGLSMRKDGIIHYKKGGYASKVVRRYDYYHTISGFFAPGGNGYNSIRALYDCVVNIEVIPCKFIFYQGNKNTIIHEDDIDGTQVLCPLDGEIVPNMTLGFSVGYAKNSVINAKFPVWNGRDGGQGAGFFKGYILAHGSYGSYGSQKNGKSLPLTYSYWSDVYNKTVTETVQAGLVGTPPDSIEEKDYVYIIDNQNSQINLTFELQN